MRKWAESVSLIQWKLLTTIRQVGLLLSSELGLDLCWLAQLHVPVFGLALFISKSFTILLLDFSPSRS